MAVKPIPEGYHTLTPYIMAENSKGFIEFLTAAFDARETFRMSHPDGTIKHAEVSIGDSQIMLSEAKSYAPATEAMYHLYVPDVDAIYEQALAAGAESIQEPSDQYYGDRTAGVRDAWRNHWWIATHVEDVSAEEISRREAELKQ